MMREEVRERDEEKESKREKIEEDLISRGKLKGFRTGRERDL